jgi:hypothetical protein
MPITPTRMFSLAPSTLRQEEAVNTPKTVKADVFKKSRRLMPGIYLPFSYHLRTNVLDNNV